MQHSVIVAQSAISLCCRAPKNKHTIHVIPLCAGVSTSVLRTEAAQAYQRVCASHNQMRGGDEGGYIDRPGSKKLLRPRPRPRPHLPAIRWQYYCFPSPCPSSSACAKCLHCFWGPELVSREAHAMLSLLSFGAARFVPFGADKTCPDRPLDHDELAPLIETINNPGGKHDK